jgi:hypothetical protein
VSDGDRRNSPGGHRRDDSDDSVRCRRPEHPDNAVSPHSLRLVGPAAGGGD